MPLLTLSPPLRPLALLALVLLSACSKPAPTEEPIRSVKLMTVGIGAMEAQIEFAGEVRARVESRLGFRVGGKITRRLVDLGQHVQAGAVLAELDAQDFQLSVDGSRAQLAAAQTNRDLARLDWQRAQSLREQNFVSTAEVDRRLTALNAAQAQLDAAQAQLSAQSNQARYTRLLADAPGVVTAVDAEVGQVVAAGSPVVRLAQDGPRDVWLAVPEDRVQAVAVGSAASVQAWGRPVTLKAQVREVAASADPVTRTFAVKVGLSGKEAPPLGATATVVLAALSHAGQPVLTVPTSALLKDGKSTAVWVLRPDTMTVHLTPVEMVTADGNAVVISKGLQPGMQVVVAGVHVLTPGQKVERYQAGPAQPASAASQ